MHHRRYLFKLYPTSQQSSILHQQCKMMADLWNALKQRREDVYRREKRSLTFFDLTNEITELRHECPEWAIVPAVTAHRVAKLLTDSYAAFYRRVKNGEEPGYPRWKRREDATTIPLGTMDKTGWTFQRRADLDQSRSWILHYKSVTDVKERATWIRARGILPAEEDDYLNGDIIWRDSKWWLSICVTMPSRRRPGRKPMKIEFDLIDGIAKVNGKLEEADDLIDVSIAQDDLDRLKSERDMHWPLSHVPQGSGPKVNEARAKRSALLARYKQDEDWQNITREIAEASARLTRIRRNFLHVWTARIVRRASDLTIIAPESIRDATRSARGDEKRHGAAVEIVSRLNRHVLNYAPASAIQMLKYKAEEAGIRCDVIDEKHPTIAIGSELPIAVKEGRKSRRKLRKEPEYAAA